MTNDYIKGKVGFYMTLESFSNSRKCERMIVKIKFPVPIHLLDHLIIPIHVRDSYNSNTRPGTNLLIHPAKIRQNRSNL